MAIGEVADDWRGEGLEEREEGAQGTAEQDDVVARVDGAGKGILVGIEVVEDAIEKGIRGGILGAVEGEERWEEREDEGEGDLGSHEQLEGWRGSEVNTYQIQQQRDHHDLQDLFTVGASDSHDVAGACRKEKGRRDNHAGNDVMKYKVEPWASFLSESNSPLSTQYDARSK